MKTVLIILACLAMLVTASSQSYLMQSSAGANLYLAWIVNSIGMTTTMVILGLALLIQEKRHIRAAGSVFLVLGSAQISGLLTGYNFDRPYLYIVFIILVASTLYLNHHLKDVT